MSCGISLSDSQKQQSLWTEKILRKINFSTLDETSTENLATSAESGTDTTGVDEMSSELFAKQGAKPKRLYSGLFEISNVYCDIY